MVATAEFEILFNCNYFCRREFDPSCVGKIPEGHGNPSQYLLGKSHRQRSLAGCEVAHGVAESDVTEAAEYTWAL